MIDGVVITLVDITESKDLETGAISGKKIPGRPYPGYKVPGRVYPVNAISSALICIRFLLGLSMVLAWAWALGSNRS